MATSSREQKARERRERKIDQALEQTFPASDTPSFVGGAASDKPPREARKKDKDKDEEPPDDDARRPPEG